MPERWYRRTIHTVQRWIGADEEGSTSVTRSTPPPKPFDARTGPLARKGVKPDRRDRKDSDSQASGASRDQASNEDEPDDFEK